MAATGRARAGTTLCRVRRILGISSPDRGRADMWLGGIITLVLLASLAVVIPLGHAQGEAKPASPAAKAGAPDQIGTPWPGNPDDSPWGETADGVSVRLRADRTRWSLRETPTFTLDFRNQGSRNLAATQRTWESCEWMELGIAGVWHRFGTRENGRISCPDGPMRASVRCLSADGE